VAWRENTVLQGGGAARFAAQTVIASLGLLTFRSVPSGRFGGGRRSLSGIQQDHPIVALSIGADAVVNLGCRQAGRRRVGARSYVEPRRVGHEVLALESIGLRRGLILLRATLLMTGPEMTVT
jgi:hypothetical protein